MNNVDRYRQLLRPWTRNIRPKGSKECRVTEQMKQLPSALKTTNGVIASKPSESGQGVTIFWEITSNEWIDAFLVLPAADVANALRKCAANMTDGAIEREGRWWYSFGNSWVLRDGDHVFIGKNSLGGVALHVVKAPYRIPVSDAEILETETAILKAEGFLLDTQDDPDMKIYLDRLDEVACKMTPDQAVRFATSLMS